MASDAKTFKLLRDSEKLLAFFKEDGMEFTLEKREELELVIVKDPYEGEWFYLPMNDRLFGVYGQPPDAILPQLQRFAHVPTTP